MKNRKFKFIGVIIFSISGLILFLQFSPPAFLQRKAIHSMSQNHKNIETDSKPKNKINISSTRNVITENDLVEDKEINPNQLNSPEDYLALVDLEKVTHRVIKDGLWADPSIWGNGEVPNSGAKVHIPEEINVVLDFTNETHLKSVRIDGSLIFATDADTQLMVDTMLVNESGILEIGNSQNPVKDGVEALLAINAYDLTNHDDDTQYLGAVLYSLGQVTMYGQEKTAKASLLETPELGDRELVLKEIPENWKQGDIVVIAGSRLERDEEYTLQVDYINGQHVGVTAVGQDQSEWEGLKNDHGIHRDLETIAVNVSRNTGISSSQPAIGAESAQGNVIFYGDGAANADLSYVGAYGLGAGTRGNDQQIVDFEKPAIAFHESTNTNPTIVEGLALVDAPESGIEVKNSNVFVSNSVAFDADGGAYLTENGSESRLLWRGKRTTPSYFSLGK